MPTLDHPVVIAAENTDPLETPQTNNTNDDAPNSPIEPIVANSNMWKGDKSYFQTGAKAGTLKPSAALFDAVGTVQPSGTTAGAVMPKAPDAPPEPKSKNTTKKTPAKQAKDETALAIANAEMVVACMDLLRAGISSGECEENLPMRGAAVAAWAAYLEEQGLALPGWVQVTVISIAYISPALATPAAKVKASGLWTRIKAAYVLWRS